MEKIKVLYIDDEVGNLNAFKASFRRLFDIYTTLSAEDGYKILKDYPIEVVIADQRMPNQTGINFFESILNIYPTPIRILLTAYTDIEAIIDAINKGEVYRYVTKPWNEFDLKLTIENAYQLYLLKEQNNKLHNKYKKVFSESTDPIILFDTKGRIIDYNKATLTLINTSNKELHFSCFNSLIVRKTERQQITSMLQENGKIKDYECQIITQDGSKKTCLISANAITDNYKEVISYQTIIKDITKRRKMQQLLLKRTIETQEEERERIARDLHDGLGQILLAVKMNLEAVSVSIEKLDNESQNIYKNSLQLLSEAIREARNISHGLMPQTLVEFGLAHAITEMVLKLNKMKNIQFDFETNIDKKRFHSELEMGIYRTVQELIHNILKHSKASLAQINISTNAKQFNVTVLDNGEGIKPSTKKSVGIGLLSIEKRIKYLGGSIIQNTNENAGTEFKITLPLI